MAAKKRDSELPKTMTEHEALMWNIEKDPWLNPNGASLTILDQPVDMERFRRHIKYGVTKMPRLHQRVAPGLGRFTTPAWAPDPEFDFDYHVRQVELPAPGTERQLLDLAARLYEEPLDRTRPLWRFVAISGIEGGKGAVWAETHHVIADGIGQLRMAELYQQISRDEPMPDDIDLTEFVAKQVAAHSSSSTQADSITGLFTSVAKVVDDVVRQQAGIGRRMVGELMMLPADPSRVATKGGSLVAAVQSAGELLTGGGNEVSGGSPLWKNRSRQRRLEYVRVPLEDLKTAAKALGGTVNDAFMVGLTEGAVRYHQKRDTVVDAFNTSFVVSTRSDNSIGGNSFTPVPVQVGGQQASFKKRMTEIRQTAENARAKSARSGGISGMSGVINLLPTSVVTSTARKQGAHIDFATSNLRGAPFPLYCAGAKVLGTVCMGPLAGTAANATALSNDGHFDIGLFIDPKAIVDGEDYRRCVESAFVDMIESAIPKQAPVAKNASPEKPSPKKPGPKKSVSKKSTAAKSTARKAPAKKSTSKQSVSS
ncbi:MAG: wax ester/triacylglycerol synthase domain-containing protein [Acidimicrobiales bacterium]